MLQFKGVTRKKWERTNVTSFLDFETKLSLGVKTK